MTITIIDRPERVKRVRPSEYVEILHQVAALKPDKALLVKPSCQPRCALVQFYTRANQLGMKLYARIEDDSIVLALRKTA